MREGAISKHVSRFFMYAFLVIVSFISVFPLYWAFISSCNNTQQILGVISQSFQDAYISTLETTSRMPTQLMQIQRILYIVQISMLILAVAVSAVFFHRVVRGMSDSVNQLIDLADGITRNPRCQEHIHLDTGDELTVFADAFNEMMDTIHAQMEKIEQNSRMREQLQKVEMENLRISSALQSSQLKLLQARINPHFLFNTLNMATQMAHMEDAEETAQLLEATADFLRYNVGKVTKSVTLLDESEHTKNYVCIQRCRGLHDRRRRSHRAAVPSGKRGLSGGSGQRCRHGAAGSGKAPQFLYPGAVRRRPHRPSQCIPAAAAVLWRGAGL